MAAGRRLRRGRLWWPHLGMRWMAAAASGYGGVDDGGREPSPPRRHGGSAGGGRSRPASRDWSTMVAGRAHIGRCTSIVVRARAGVAAARTRAGARRFTLTAGLRCSSPRHNGVWDGPRVNAEQHLRDATSRTRLRAGRASSDDAYGAKMSISRRTPLAKHLLCPHLDLKLHRHLLAAHKLHLRPRRPRHQHLVRRDLSRDRCTPENAPGQAPPLSTSVPQADRYIGTSTIGTL